MKLHILILTLAISVFAFDIDVVSCEDVLRTDPVPSDKIDLDVLNDIKQHPTDFVCAYNPSDVEHKKGWFAIEKKRRAVFIWHKNETSVTEPESRTITHFGSTDCVSSYNKYGIRSVECYGSLVLDKCIDGLLTGVESCFNF